jgi:hypothetical protein
MVEDVGRLAGKRLSKDKRAASKSLRAETFTCEILALHMIETTPLFTNID